MFKVVDGDIFDSTEDFLCHQCNCVTKRSAHMAAAVFKRYPYADVYTERYEHDKPGTVKIRNTLDTNDRIIINMFGQYYPGYSKWPNSYRDGHEARQTYFKSCLDAMKKMCGKGTYSFAFPWRIGCGAAGGDWGAYIEMLKDFEASIDGNVTIYKLHP